jgi:hypothetical protein
MPMLPRQGEYGGAAGKSAGQFSVQPDGLVEIVQRAFVLLRVGSHAAAQIEGLCRRRIAPDRLVAIRHRQIELSEPASRTKACCWVATVDPAASITNPQATTASSGDCDPSTAQVAARLS